MTTDIENIPQEDWEDCPNCPNIGYVEVTTEISISYDMLPIPEPLYLEQCEFCWTNPNSVYYQENELWKN